MNHPEGTVCGDATFVSAKITHNPAGGEDTQEPLESLKADLSALVEANDIVNGSFGFISKFSGEQYNKMAQIAEKSLEDGVRYTELIAKKQNAGEIVTDTLKKISIEADDTYTDAIRTMNRMDNMEDLADMSKSAMKPYADFLGAVGTVMTVNEYIGYHTSLIKIGQFLPEECDPDEEDFKYIKFKLTMANIDQVANDLLFIGYEVLDKALEATIVGAIPALGISLLTSAVTDMTSDAMRADIQEIKNMALNLDCNGDGIPDGDPMGVLNNLGSGFMLATTVIDPSGYVYEAVPSNRVEGVKSEIYYLGYALDEYGIAKDQPEEILWDAENYDQINPYYTDELGRFHWDVPIGQWVVKFSKEGYYDTDSRNDPAANEDGYLPVPPPQVQVNTAIVSKAAPTVESVNIYDDQVQIIFSQYMQINSVNTDHVIVSCAGKNVEGTLKPVNAEYNYEETIQYASVFAFIPEQKLDGTATVKITDCINYAGTTMEKSFQVTDNVKFRPERISAEKNMEIAWNGTSELSVQILPAKAGVNQKISVSCLSSSILASSSQTVTTDEQGRALIELTGLLPGTTDVILRLDDTDITASVSVCVKQKPQTCKKVTANLPSGAVVEQGTKLTLQTATEGAEIYYTLDGTCPCIVDSPSRIHYTGPIVLKEDTFLIAYAVKEGMTDSATSGFMYSIQAKECAHSETKLIHVKPATCTEKGYSGDTVCIQCQKTVIPGKEIPVIAHLEVIDKAVDATCTNPGKTEGKHCAVCQTILTQQYTVPARGYQWNEWKVTKPATGADEGEEKRICSVCAGEEKRSIPKLTHPFVDVVPGMFYEMPVLWAVDNRVTNGIDETHFAPDATCNRSQVVTFLWRAAGSPEPTSNRNPFTDVREGVFYFDAVLWAVEKGITNGTSATTFSPDDNCTRGQVATFLWRTLGQPIASNSKHPFMDIAQDQFYYDAVLWAVEAGVTNGMTPTTFEPNKSCTRGQIVTFLYRALG